MKAAIFLGPSLPVGEASRRCSALFLPPAAQGDVLRVARERPLVIGIVDGYFDGVPSIWHKEILWALTQGIHVFGASSMGALRAAELASFGMKGVGEIFRTFRSGALEDDDEVAVAHTDAGSAYRATSEAMVNIRATLEGAERSGVVGSETCRELVAIAKALFYPDRSYPRILGEALERGLPSREIEALRGFVPIGRVDQKRQDALALLDAVEECCKAGVPPAPAAFSFSNTEAWANAFAWAESQPPIVRGASSTDATLIAAEARLSDPEARGLFAAALSRAAAGVIARRLGRKDRGHDLDALDQRTRQAHGVSSCEEDVDRWLDAQGLTAESYRGFLERGVDLEWLQRHLRNDLSRYVVDELRARGEYSALAQRASDKREVLATRGLSEPRLGDAGMGGQELMQWYFNRLGRPAPRDIELFLAEMGITDVATVQQEALQEFLYSRPTVQID